MNKIIILLYVLSTLSCSVPQVKNPKNIKALLPIGSTLRLTQKLIIPKERDFIYIANGKVAPLKNYNTVDIYEPYCTFYLDKEALYERIIYPGEFKVTNIFEMERNYSRLDFMKAVRNTNRTAGMIKVRAVSNSDGGPSIVMYATVISLHSDKQPDVKKMVCGHWNDPHEIEPLTLKEMESALGDLILMKNRILINHLSVYNSFYPNKDQHVAIAPLANNRF